MNISIAMATYNGARFLGEQLESIESQSISPFELVVCDDGSTDETLSILSEFSSRVSFPVRVVKNESNLGFSNNFLKCASLCSGDWITFCDQDDVWLENKLLKLMHAIEKTTDKTLLVYHSASLVDEHLEPLGASVPVINQQQTCGRLSQECFWFVGGCVMCFHSSLVGDLDHSLRPKDSFEFNPAYIKGSVAWMPHDKWISLLANTLGNSVAIPFDLGLYRRHSDTVTAADHRASLKDRISSYLSYGGQSYGFLASSTLEYAQVFEKLACMAGDESKREHLFEASRKAQEISDAYSIRARIHRFPGFVSRLRWLTVMLKRGYYFSGKFSPIGGKALLKDVLIVFFGHQNSMK